jgi:glucose-1-phosphate cytidylyltransferase
VEGEAAMKVVLFCGGLGTRLQEYSTTIPKPMVEIGYRPIIWHLMKYYAHFGHKDFILCLGYRGDYIKNYFLHYDECLSNDFVLSKGGKELELYNSDISEWTISFIETGLNSNIGQRLKAVEGYLEGEDVFLANYSDGLTDLPLPEQIEHFYRADRIASMLCVKPSQTFDVLSMGADSFVEDMEPISKADLWINGGFFIFKKDIFEYIRPGEELVCEPFQRLIAQNQLLGYRYRGFWACMDTYKEKRMFDTMYSTGQTPWAVWESTPGMLPSMAPAPRNGPRGEKVILDRSNLVAHYRYPERIIIK